MTSSSSHSRIAFILAMAVALGPFAIDTYLPAFPDIAKAIGADIHDVSLSISVYILGLAIGQLIGGPLSDRLGRSRIMLTGLAVFLFSCLMLSQSESLASLLIWRFTQAFGGGWCAVSVPAIIRDRTEGQETAKLFSLIGLIMIAAPAIAPTLGSTILAFADWRWIFLFLALYTGVVIVTLWFSLFADAPPHSPPPKRNVLADYLEILKNTAALRFIFIQSLGFSVMLTFLTHASFIYQEWFGLSEFAFSLLFAGNIAVMALMSMANRALLTWVESAQLLRLAVWLQTFGVILLIAIVFFYPSLYLFAPALMLSVGSLGAAMPNGSACFIQFFKSNSGTASALMGALQFTISGAISALSSALSDGTLVPIVAVMLMCALLNAAFAWGAPGAARKAIANA